ncbi:hypothetical protein Lmor_2409 [Legionella moravica]|uniref:Uncharacterized protein n=1 Tax=Legionella moravica TaxID=39962 RepID=A0A378JVV0_9GAMM|nr:hypothetical protein [Legionella moravica]KTD32471.1 hypothetical protein Lmor_2409 [Legionella moravica]STX62566.1 Uncharacterised protein [Legionella moravica]
MILKDLIKTYLVSSYEKQEAVVYIAKNSIDTIIPNEMVRFIDKFSKNKPINNAEFQKFSQQLSSLNNLEKNCIIHLLFKITSNTYEQHKSEIEKDIKNLESNLIAGKELTQQSLKNATKYIGLLNCYQLFAHHVSTSAGIKYLIYPGISSFERSYFSYALPFSINVLRLVGKLPLTNDFNGIDLSKAFYPLHLKVIKTDRNPLKKGIKNSDVYFPYKMISKIVKGNSGNNTFVATNGKKILFIRGVEHYSPNAILASKIATLVSPIHFSSERLLDNRLVGSRGIPGYAVSVADHNTREARKKYIEQEKRIFPGTGIIDEVTNFVGEGDVNVENYGLSSQDVYQSHLTKIDFDRCNVTSKKSKEHYENNMLTCHERGIYHNASHVQSNPEYIKEKLFTRLKLAMLSQELLSSLANKAYSPGDEDKRMRAVDECTNRSTIALELFFEHPHVHTFLHQDPSILDQCYHQIAEYISSHFEEEDQELLQLSLRERVEFIKTKAKETLDINLTLTEYEPIKPETHENFDLIDDETIERHIELDIIEEFHKSVSVVTPNQSSFLSRNWIKLLGVAILTMVGVGIGVTLTAIVFFAPLGIGIAGFSLATAVGLGAGLLTGAAIFGTTIAYDEHQFRTSRNNEVAAKIGNLTPSPKVEKLIEEVNEDKKKIKKGFARVENELLKINTEATTTDHDQQSIISNTMKSY